MMAATVSSRAAAERPPLLFLILPIIAAKFKEKVNFPIIYIFQTFTFGFPGKSGYISTRE